MDAAVIEFDALPDAIGPSAQHNDLFTASRRGLTLFLVGRIKIGRGGGKLGGTGVDALVNRPDAQFVPRCPHLEFLATE